MSVLRKARKWPLQSPIPGVAGWLKENLFASTRDTVLTILTFLLLVWMVPPILDWAFISAVWTGESREDCIVPGAGACWAFVEAKFGQFIYGRYPLEERWRVDLTGLLLIIGLVPIAIPSRALQARKCTLPAGRVSRFSVSFCSPVSFGLGARLRRRSGAVCW
jgi:general L-amino acid transport system permease protein